MTLKNASEYAKRLKKLLTHLRKLVEVPKDYEILPPLDQLIVSYLTWNSTADDASKVFKHLNEHFIDYNDLRVSSPGELAQAIGSKYPQSSERAFRLRLTLQDIYNREHRMDLSSILALNKRDAKNYLETLSGIPSFVTASIMLFSVEAHAIPVDEQLFNQLVNDEVVDPDSKIEEVISFLEHQVRADDGVEAYFLLRAYAEGVKDTALSFAKPKKKAKTEKKTTKKKTATKKTTKKSTKKKVTKKKTAKKAASTKKKTTKKKTSRKK